MTAFGDTEPEDAWHPDDPVEILIDNLARRMALLDHRHPKAVFKDRGSHLEHLASRLQSYEKTSMVDVDGDRAHVRLRQLHDDLAHVRQRLQGS